ncbi:enoyl-ACP reductase [Acidobacteria bacterium Mor1]|nr:enoyl-ACP reductase [Acidobacteria bacterium Mor1]
MDLSGKTALITGVANQRSLAWAIGDALGEAGCQLAFTYQGERLHKNVTELAKKYPDAPILSCDVNSTEQIDGVFSAIEKRLGGRLDIMVHSIAFARKEDLEGDFRKTTRDGWRTAMEISAYSLVSLTKRAVPLMEKTGGSIMALSFLASQRVFHNYNVMGSAKAALEHAVRQLAFELGPKNIRVNTISAGPVNTLSARGIKGFSNMATLHREKAPLGRNIEPSEVGDAGLFLASPMSTGITGHTLYVDAGYNIMGI